LIVLIVLQTVFFDGILALTAALLLLASQLHLPITKFPLGHSQPFFGLQTPIAQI